MKIFNDYSEALSSYNKKPKFFINSLCPFCKDEQLCGNWCSFFYYDEGTEYSASYVILGCKGTDKKLYIG